HLVVLRRPRRARPDHRPAREFRPHVVEHLRRPPPRNRAEGRPGEGPGRAGHRRCRADARRTRYHRHHPRPCPAGRPRRPRWPRHQQGPVRPVRPRPRRDRHHRTTDALRARPPPLDRQRPRSPARRTARPARMGRPGLLHPRHRTVRPSRQQRLQPGAVSGMHWDRHAQRLANQITAPPSPWWEAIVRVPRHIFVPRWWRRGDPATGPYGTAHWTAISGAADRAAWAAAAYSDRTLVTRVGPHHADNTGTGRIVTGAPTSSATQPSLLV